jgi:hypothetical protein
VTPPLGRLDPQGRLQLYLASRSNDSGGSIDFTLRRVRWEDGVAVSPRDFIATAHLVRLPEIASPDRRRTDLIANCVALDDSTLHIEFRTLYGGRVRDALFMPVAAHALPPQADYARLQRLPFTNQPQSCGPYRIIASDGGHLRLVRHDGAGFPPAWIDSVDVQMFEPDPAVAAYVAGQVDVLVDLPADRLQAARRRPSRTVALVGASYLFMGWNLRDSRFDLAVRRAVARGVDLERLRRTATFGQGDRRAGR